MDNEALRLQNDIQDVKDQNELLEFRILELEVTRVRQKHQQQQQGEIVTLTNSLFLWKTCLLFRRGNDAHLALTSSNYISQKASVPCRSTVRRRESL